MNHIKNIAKELHNLGLDAMLVTSEPGEFYAMGFHGEGVAFITPQECWYYTDSRYIEASNQEISGAHVDMLRSGQSYRQLVISYPPPPPSPLCARSTTRRTGPSSGTPRVPPPRPLPPY